MNKDMKGHKLSNIPFPDSHFCYPHYIAKTVPCHFQTREISRVYRVPNLLEGLRKIILIPMILETLTARIGSFPRVMLSTLTLGASAYP